MPSIFAADARYHIDPDRFVRREVGGETVLVPIRGNDIAPAPGDASSSASAAVASPSSAGPSAVADVEYLYRLNGVAAIVWDAIIAGETLGQAVERVLAAFDFGATPPSDARAQVQADVAAFAADLEEAGLARP